MQEELEDDISAPCIECRLWWWLLLTVPDELGFVTEIAEPALVEPPRGETIASAVRTFDGFRGAGTGLLEGLR